MKNNLSLLGAVGIVLETVVSSGSSVGRFSSVVDVTTVPHLSPGSPQTALASLMQARRQESKNGATPGQFNARA